MKNLPRFALAAALSLPTMAAYATAPQRPVVNTCHGVAVTDNYQWLENADTGHGIGTALSDRIAEVTDYFCFLFEAPQIPVK